MYLLLLDPITHGLHLGGQQWFPNIYLWPKPFISNLEFPLQLMSNCRVSINRNMNSSAGLRIWLIGLCNDIKHVIRGSQANLGSQTLGNAQIFNCGLLRIVSWGH